MRRFMMVVNVFFAIVQGLLSTLVGGKLNMTA
jgi:hypothetical protein